MKEERLKKYIERGKKIHNDHYIYLPELVDVQTCKDHITVICKEHGEFITTWDNHINNKQGCPKCKKVYKPSNDEFIERIRSIYGDKYDYSKVQYTKMNDKVTLICHERDEDGNEHGEFTVFAKHLVNGNTGCKKCSHTRTRTFSDFVRSANKKHNNKYEYIEGSYIDTQHKVSIICHEKDKNGVEHGVFEQVVYSHLNGCGCPKCSGGVSHSKDVFIREANDVHGSYYSYGNFNYINARTKGLVTCPIHGDFLQTPYQHLKGQGCPKCKSSLFENMVLRRLEKEGIDYIFQYNIETGKRQKCDFYIPSANIVIECQGEQHFTPVSFSRNQNAETSFKRILQYDLDKYQYCINNSIQIVYFTIPTLFHDASISIDIDFYKSKIVFTQIDNLINFIKSNIKNGNSKQSDTFVEFCDVLRQSINTPLKVYDNNIVQLQSLFIKFVPLMTNTRTELNDVRREYRKHNKKLVIVFEDEFIEHQYIVISKILRISGVNSSKLKRIGARKCTIHEIDNATASDFLTKNHIQGFVNSSIYLGAYYNDRLMGVMTFLEEKSGYWNLTRFATDNNYLCSGLGGKMFSFFKRHYDYIEVKSFADKRWTINENNLYVQLGFIQMLNMNPEYRYFNIEKDGMIRLHKFNFRKQILNKKYGLPLTMTESEMTKALGYDRIWDCGLLKYVYTNPNVNYPQTKDLWASDFIADCP